MATTLTSQNKTSESFTKDSVSESFILYQEGMHYLNSGEWDGLKKAREMFKKAYKLANDADDIIEDDLCRALEMLKKIASNAISWRPQKISDTKELEAYKDDEARKAYNFLELYDLI